MQYNLCNEPWLKYSMGGVADRGLKRSQWTSARLNDDVLYVETHTCASGKPEGGEQTWIYTMYMQFVLVLSCCMRTLCRGGCAHVWDSRRNVGL